MPTTVYDSDHTRAEGMLIGPFAQLREVVALCIAMERERCAKLAESYMGATKETKRFGKEVADYIRKSPQRSLPSGQGGGE